ncbi:MAG TPA: hypothetical protein VF534_31035 [Paraburkholderia sp.]
MWKKFFDGIIADRVIILESDEDGDNFYDDGNSCAVRVETRPWVDHRHDSEVVAGKAGPRESDCETVKFEAGTAEDLERVLIEQAGFTLSAAKEIARIAGLTDEDTFAGEPAYLSSRLVPGVHVASFDADLVRGLRLNTVDKWLEYPRMQIAIRNETGDAYRTIGADSMGEWINTIQWFLAQGYTDELGPDGGTWKGCDAVFSRKA